MSRLSIRSSAGISLKPRPIRNPKEKPPGALYVAQLIFDTDAQRQRRKSRGCGRCAEGPQIHSDGRACMEARTANSAQKRGNGAGLLQLQFVGQACGAAPLHPVFPCIPEGLSDRGSEPCESCSRRSRRQDFLPRSYEARHRPARTAKFVCDGFSRRSRTINSNR